MHKNEIMLFKVWKNTENINPRVWSSSDGRPMILSKCAICGSKKSRFVKNSRSKRTIIQFRCQNAIK